MLSKVSELPRYRADCERFRQGVAGHSGELRAEGQQLFEDLKKSVEVFDNSFSTSGHGARSLHMDHVMAKEVMVEAKLKMEQWMLRHAPNVHIDESQFQ
jgi:hypothetical protein